MTFDLIEIISSGKKPTIMIKEISVEPYDYNTGKWIKVINKRKKKKENKLNEKK